MNRRELGIQGLVEIPRGTKRRLVPYNWNNGRIHGFGGEADSHEDRWLGVLGQQLDGQDN
jgi:hypothetical protein